jgi:acyl-CoA reductase-like NAD-dependent aldehyde dehydrogenase
MRMIREETFGSLALIFAFDTVDEVHRMANDTEFVLAGYLYSANLNVIWQVARELEVGMVGVNREDQRTGGTVRGCQGVGYGERRKQVWPGWVPGHQEHTLSV